MTEIRCVVFVVVLAFLLSLTRGDVEVSCVFKQSCILPCSFKAGTDMVIHWIQETTGNTHAHSYYYNQDQLPQQGQNFRGRTSLFKDQISRGNASLQLTGVQVQDQGRYKCYTSTFSGNQDSFISLKVDAPIRKVNIQQVENRITCSSEGIYPEPILTWSTSPPLNVTFKDTTTVQQTEQQLYNINSSLMLSDNVPDLVYSCTVSTRRNRRRATLFKGPTITGSDTETTISCTSLNTPLTSLVWRFNHSQIILNQTRTSVPYTVSEEWKQQVKSMSESGSLTLQDLSLKQEGIYTCELSNAEETHIMDTFLRINKSPEPSQRSIRHRRTGGIVVAAAFLFVVVAAGIAVCIHSKKNLGKQKADRIGQTMKERPGENTNRATSHKNYDSSTTDYLPQENEDSKTEEVDTEGTED